MAFKNAQLETRARAHRQLAELRQPLKIALLFPIAHIYITVQ